MQNMNCPHCTRPVIGVHHVDEQGRQWHLSCAELLIVEKPQQQRTDEESEALL